MGLGETFSRVRGRRRAIGGGLVLKSGAGPRPCLVKFYRESLGSVQAEKREMKVVLEGWGRGSKPLAWAVAVVPQLTHEGSASRALVA